MVSKLTIKHPFTVKSEWSIAKFNCFTSLCHFPEESWVFCWWSSLELEMGEDLFCHTDLDIQLGYNYLMQIIVLCYALFSHIYKNDHVVGKNK